MDANNLSSKPQPVNSVVLESTCHECQRFRTKRGALVVEVQVFGQTREAFICDSCCRNLFCDGFGYSRECLQFFLERQLVSSHFGKQLVDVMFDRMDRAAELEGGAA